jgi:purine-binding chemotaxis protein CheW
MTETTHLTEATASEWGAQIAERERKIEKLRNYIARLEADGDRLARELAVANSYRSIIDHLEIATPMFMVDAGRRIQYGNEAFLKVTEMSVEHLKDGVSCCDALKCLSGGKACLIATCVETKERQRDAHSEFLNASERRFRFDMQAMPIINVATGESLGVYGILNDLREDTQIQHLMFDLSEQEYGVNIKRLKCIVSSMEINHVPTVPAFVLGTINLRGQIVPVVDIKERLGLLKTAAKAGEVMLIFEVGNGEAKRSYGVVVDAVNGVVTIDMHDIEPVETAGVASASGCVVGVAKIGTRARVILNAERMFLER